MTTRDTVAWPGNEATGAVLFARAIVAESLREVSRGTDPEAIRRGIDCAADAAMDAFEKCWGQSGTGCAPAAGERSLAEIAIGEVDTGRAEAADREARASLARRLARLEGCEARVRPEAAETFRRKKARLAEALHALGCARSALSGMRGKSAGEDAGIAAVRFALDEPARQIARLADKDPEVIMNSVLEGMGQYGVAAAQGGYGDLVEAGAVDAHRAMRQALKCASALGARAVSSRDPMFGGLGAPQARQRFFTPNRR